LPMTQVQIPNYLLPSPVPADILLDDDSERSHQIIKKQGRPPKNQRKRNAATAPKYIKKHGTYYPVINVFFEQARMRNIGKIFCVLGIIQLCVSWMQGNFSIKQFGTSYWIPT
jgi:hypothetical protein